MIKQVITKKALHTSLQVLTALVLGPEAALAAAPALATSIWEEQGGEKGEEEDFVVLTVVYICIYNRVFTCHSF